ncbi:MAG: hypothetical protein ABSA93_19765 [Streptosporangiaceae bacterium]
MTSISAVKPLPQLLSIRNVTTIDGGGVTVGDGEGRAVCVGVTVIVGDGFGLGRGCRAGTRVTTGRTEGLALGKSGTTLKP